MQSLVNLQVLTAVKDSMVEFEDLDGLKILWRFGCSFGLHSLSNPVKANESMFLEWTVDGETHHKHKFSLTHDGLQDVDRVAATMTIDMWRVDDWTFAAFIKDNVKGLSFKAASFAAALMGWNTPAVDILALKFGYGMSKAEAEAHRGKWRKWEDYFKDAYALFRMDVRQQWTRYGDWQETYAEGGHQPYFDALYAALGGLLIVPPTPPTDMVKRAEAQARTAAKRAATMERKAAAKLAASAA